MTAAPARAALTGPVAVTPRPLEEYRAMFLLTDDELAAGPILDCPSGASPFGAQVRARGGRVVSADPAYGEADTLVARARADLDRIAAWHRSNPGAFDWDHLGSPEALAADWSDALDVFAEEFTPDGSRYVAAALPSLPFPDRHFTTAVSAFLLFVYPDLLDFDGHRDALLELARVTRGEVRVFPLHDTTGTRHPDLDTLRTELRGHGVESELRRAGCAYSVVPESDRMLVLGRR
jgi:hypothetical protein